MRHDDRPARSTDPEDFPRERTDASRSKSRRVGFRRVSTRLDRFRSSHLRHTRWYIGRHTYSMVIISSFSRAPAESFRFPSSVQKIFDSQRCQTSTLRALHPVQSRCEHRSWGIRHAHFFCFYLLCRDAHERTLRRFARDLCSKWGGGDRWSLHRGSRDVYDRCAGITMAGREITPDGVARKPDASSETCAPIATSCPVRVRSVSCDRWFAACPNVIRVRGWCRHRRLEHVQDGTALVAR